MEQVSYLFVGLTLLLQIQASQHFFVWFCTFHEFITKLDNARASNIQFVYAQDDASEVIELLWKQQWVQMV